MSIARKTQAGFTLVEIMVAGAIMVLLGGAVVMVMQGTLRATSDLGELQNRMQETEGFFELCRRAFGNLPSQATLDGRFREEAGVSVTEVMIRNSSHAFEFGSVAAVDGMVTLGQHRTPAGAVDLVVRREGNASAWDLTILSELREVRWRFFDLKSLDWQASWDSKQGRPALVEITLVPAGDAAPSRSVFWVPPLTPES